MPRILLRLLLALAPIASAVQPPATPPPAAPPDTEIVLAPLGDGTSVGRPVNITNNPGYDNQPAFTPDGAAILFTSIRGGGTQTDIYRYDIAPGSTTRVTSTPESEYSPTVTPDGAHISVIRVEADGTQRLWRFTIDGTSPELVLADVKPVGYHAWADAHTLALFVLGPPATLRLADTADGRAEILVTGINRASSAFPAAARSASSRARPAMRPAAPRCRFASSIRRPNGSRRSWMRSPARAKPTAPGRRTARS